MMFAIIYFIVATYVAVIILTIFGWTYHQPISQVKSTASFVSVIIPFRNEEANLKQTIRSILENDTSQFEILLVNDHSEDNSLQICQEFESQHQNIKVLSLKEELGKKAAIKLGVQNSTAEIILQTDADCIVEPSWISTMQNEFTNSIKLLIGPVKVHKSKGAWNWFNQLEFAYLQSITAATSNFNHPIMANGANLMYNKKVYWEYVQSNIGTQYASGDDQFLLEYIKLNYSTAISYVKNKKAVVSTIFPDEWKEMTQQRCRWASKNTNAKDIKSLFGALILFAHFTLPTTLLLSIFSSQYFDLFLDIFLLKTGIEIILGIVILKFFDLKIIKYVPFFAIIYPLFLFNVLTLVKLNKNDWKGRGNQ